jgi:hypothetical protein
MTERFVNVGLADHEAAIDWLEGPMKRVLLADIS